MSWRDNMRPASFRGVPFYVRKTSDDLGRLAGVHQVFGTGDDAVGVAYDNGRALDVHTIEAFVGGDDYLDDLDALEAALLEGGPGDLVHPFRGSMLVVVLPGLSVDQDGIENGGVASIRFTVKRTSSSRAGLRTRALPTEATRTAAAATADAAGADFAEKFSVADLPAAYHESAPTGLAAVGAVLADLEAAVSGSADGVTAGLSQVAALGDRATGLLATPSALAADVRASVSAVFDAARSAAVAAQDLAALNPLTAVTEFRRLARALLHSARSVFALQELVPDTGPVTVNRTREAANLTALRTLVLATVTAETARTLTWTPYSSRIEAMSALDEVLTLMDVVDLVAEDATFRAMGTLRQQTAAYLKDVARTLPEVTTYTTATWTKAALIAHELYGDATRADEIAARNQLTRPGMIPPGLDLEVLVG